MGDQASGEQPDIAHQHATTRFLFQISQRLTTALSVRDAVAAYLLEVAARGQYHCSVRLDQFDAQGQRCGTIVHGRWMSEGLVLTEKRLPYLLGTFDAELDAGQVVTVRDYQTDPRLTPALRALQASVGRRAFAIIPLIVRGHRIGRVNLSCQDPHDWSDAELQPFQVSAALLAAALDSRQQAVDLAEQAQRLAVLEERRRLARELHDSVTQSLVSVSLLAQSLAALWEVDQEWARRGLETIGDQSRAALAEMRALLFELRGAGEGGWDLPRTLRQHVAAFEQRTGLAVALAIDEAGDLPDAVAYALSRIAQEALTNIARHARARQVTAALAAGPPLRLCIQDDGQGFEPTLVQGDHLGLVSMRERAAGIRARLDLESVLGAGTRVIVTWDGTAGAHTGG